MPYTNCLAYGKDFYRSFDGSIFSYEGQCTNIFAEDRTNSWSIFRKMKTCPRGQPINLCTQVGLLINLSFKMSQNYWYLSYDAQ